MAPLLKIENISKYFPGVCALDKVNLEIEKGEVRAIVGENGAGKTTLMRVLTGIYQSDSGQIYFDGKPVAFTNTKESQKSGVAIIHQELNLPVNLKIEENVFLGRFPTNVIKLVDRKKLSAQTKELLDIVGLNKKPSAYVENLSIAEQQLVEIAKALSLQQAAHNG